MADPPGAAGPPARKELLLTGLIAAVVLVAALPLFYGTGILTGSELFFTHDGAGSDLWHLHYPIKDFYRRELAAGRLPLWCPEIGTGFPLHAEGQVAALYPLNLLLFGLLPLAQAFNWGILIHFLLAGVFAAMYARQMGAGRGGSAVAAIVFAFSGFFVTHLKHVNMTAAAVWIPLLLLLMERYAERRRPFTAMLFAVTVGAMVLAGHPQIAYYNLLVAAGYAAYLLVRTWLRGREAGGGARRAAGLGGGLLYAAVLGVLLGAPQILPTHELNRLGPRRGGLSFAEATEWEYRWEHLLAFVSPKAFGDPGELRERTWTDPQTGRPVPRPDGDGYVRELVGFDQDPEHPALFWETTGYVGLLPLLLAVAAVGLGLRRRVTWLLLALLGVSLLLALGKNGGLATLFFHVLPGFDLFRFQDRFLLHVGLFLAVLAGLGLTRIVERLPRTRRRSVGVPLALVAGAVCFLDLRMALGDHNPKVPAGAWTAAPASVERIRRDAGPDPAPFRFARNDETHEVFRNAYYRARGWKGDLSPYETARLMVDPNQGVLFGLCSFDFYFQLYPRWMKDAEDLLHIPRDPKRGRPELLNPRIAALYNIRYALDPNRALESPFTLLETYDGGRRLLGRLLLDHPWSPLEIRLLRNPEALPRAFLVPGARVVEDPRPADPETPGPAVLAVVDGGFDPRREVLLHPTREQSEATLPSPPGDPIEAPVRILEYSPQRVRLAVDAPRSCWLFFSDTWYPGWTASVDGVSRPILRADVTGRAVQVGPGRHEVVFEFDPASLRTGLVLAAVAILLLASRGLQGRLFSRIARAKNHPMSCAPDAG